MKSPMIIGLSGKAEHGKSAASRIIYEAAEEMGLKAKIFEISELIRQHCVSLGLLPATKLRADFTNEEIKVLVDEGTRMRAVDLNYWTDLFMLQIAAADCGVAVVPNLRFPTESQRIRNAGGWIVRINRLNADGSPFVSMTRDPNHETETALDNWRADLYITNVTGHGKLLEGLVKTVFHYICEQGEQ